MKKSRICIIALLAAVSTAAAAQQRGPQPRTPQQARVSSLVGSSQTLRGATVGIMAITESGDTLVALDCDRMLVPASNMKLITTGAALHRLGQDYRYPTSLSYDGQIENGVLHGDLVITGGGDPTLGSLDSIVPPVGRTFEAWKKMLESKGISSIDGKIIGDGSAYDGAREHQSWEWEDIGTYYGTGGSGLAFCENLIRLRVAPGATEGDAVSVKQLYPLTPWLDIHLDCSTGKTGTGDRLYLFATDFSKEAVLRGTYAAGKGAKTLKCSNKYPELTCAGEFAAFLGSGKAEGHPEGVHYNSLKPLGETYSPKLERIVRFTNCDSNNFFAETMFRTLGRELTGSACYDSSAVALNRTLGTMGLSTTHGAHIVDGSGLSRENYISPAFFCKFLAAMMESPAWDAFLASLPRPGIDGTVKDGFRLIPESKRGQIWLKSGSMGGVRCYSGYYIPENGETVIFSVMINNCTARSAALRSEADKLVWELLR